MLGDKITRNKQAKPEIHMSEERLVQVARPLQFSTVALSVGGFVFLTALLCGAIAITFPSMWTRLFISDNSHYQFTLWDGVFSALCAGLTVGLWTALVFVPLYNVATRIFRR